MRALHFFNIFVALLTFSSCANMGSPSGGEKDTMSPLLLQSEPPNYSISFAFDEIRLRFDEYVVLEESKVVISPPIEENIVTSMHGKEVRIRFKGQLLPNTTYTISLDEAIKDLNEGNAFRGDKYIFSTGEYLDSARFTGKLIDPENPKGPESFVVGLFPADLVLDSLANRLPRYYSRTSGNGLFQMDYLAHGEYRFVAYEDLNNDLKPDLTTDRIAILNKSVTIPEDSALSLTIYKEVSEPLFRGGRQVLNNELAFLFSGAAYPWVVARVDSASKGTDILWMRGDTLRYFYREAIDSMVFLIHGPSDMDTSVIYMRDKKRKNDLTFRSSIRDGKLLPEERVNLLFPIPLDSIDRKKIELRSGDQMIELTIQDSSAEKGCVELQFQREYGQAFEMHILDSAFRDIAGRWSDTLLTPFKVPLERELGRIGVSGLGGHAVIAELWSQDMKRSFRMTLQEDSTYMSSGLLPGIYVIRLVGDQNGSGKWDSGSLEAGNEAEKVYFYPEIIQVRENWDLEYEIGKEFVEELTN